jgi:Ca2+-binding EF-hand superfamily protein
MKRHYKTIPAALLLLGVCAMLSSHISALEIPQRGPIPFDAFDMDGNGLISEAEFYTVRGERMSNRAAAGKPMQGAADAPSFTAFDTNGDGVLEPEELAAGQQAQREKRHMKSGGQGHPKSSGMGMGRHMPGYSDFDLNGDGKVIAEEFDEARSKRIAKRLEQGYQMRNLPNAPSFDELDTNGDGAISPDEFAAHQAKRLPQNMPE